MRKSEKWEKRSEAAEGRKLTYSERLRIRKKTENFDLIRELDFSTSVEAAVVSAETAASLDRPCNPDDWFKVIWYSDSCGGKLVRFKAGNPYLPKGKRAKLPDEDEAAAAEMRLSASVSRTKRRIYEIMACNEWDWFFTGTLDPEKNDVNDLNGVYKRFSQFLRDFRKTLPDGSEKIHYCIIPEQHKSGAWHFHGVLGGLPAECLHKFELSENIPKRLKDMIKGGTPVYTWKRYEKRFGWATLTAVQSHEAISKYVTKYVTKDMAAANVGTNRHMYYTSQGLNAPVTLAEGTSRDGVLFYTDYENEYIGIRNISEREEAAAIARRLTGGHESNNT